MPKVGVAIANRLARADCAVSRSRWRQPHERVSPFFSRLAGSTTTVDDTPGDGVRTPALAPAIAQMRARRSATERPASRLCARALGPLVLLSGNARRRSLVQPRGAMLGLVGRLVACGASETALE